MTFFINSDNQVYTGDKQAGDREAAPEEIECHFSKSTYSEKRAAAYPAFGDQLDMMYWDQVNGTSVWRDAIAAVKAKYPKPVDASADAALGQEAEGTDATGNQ